jgi:hydrogenase expression/formation protein HypD
VKYLDEFRNPRLAAELVKKIASDVKSPLKYMEVCGTHTVSIFRSGLRDLLPEGLTLLSGPGCPVCVTSQLDIDKAIGFASIPGVILTTYGDMMKVPGTRSSLQREKAAGADVRMVYSTADAVALAERNPDRQVIFLGVGFETTTPGAALSILEARRRNLQNYRVFSVHKLVPPVLKALVESEDLGLDGFLMPGHVSVIIGANAYRFLADEYHIPAVVAGFEPLDILQSLYMLIRQANEGRAEVEIQYSRAVKPEGNLAAQKILGEVFEPVDTIWRGLGPIPGSGLAIRKEFEAFDAEKAFTVDVSYSREPAGCACGEILRGVKSPADCRLFAGACTPEHPVGPCMVSTEGTCSAHYAYGRRRLKPAPPTCDE